MTLKNNILLFIMFCTINLVSCYSFRQGSVSNSLKTYSVQTFQTNASLAPPQAGVQFSEALKDRIRNDSPLRYDNNSADIAFEGSLIQYNITSEAPKQGELTAISRLTIRFEVNCIHKIEPNKSWKKEFEYFANFDANVNVISIREKLHSEIFTKILDDVYNQTFGDW